MLLKCLVKWPSPELSTETSNSIPNLEKLTLLKRPSTLEVLPFVGSLLCVSSSNCLHLPALSSWSWCINIPSFPFNWRIRSLAYWNRLKHPLQGLPLPGLDPQLHMIHSENKNHRHKSGSSISPSILTTFCSERR